MKTVYIVRHAKSSWNHPDLSDEERPLLEKGKKRTKKVIDSLLEKNISVDYIISSPAVRAYETAKILAHALKYPLENIRQDPHVYFADGDSLFSQFYDIPDTFESLMIVGHNPALTDFVNHFMKPRIDNLPTSGLVCINFDTDHWDKVPSLKGKVSFSLFPKAL
jgi:phosphohistidine phosphatase